MRKRTQFERLVTQKSMDFVSNAQNEKLTDFMIESGEVDRHMKNLCTKVSIPLYGNAESLNVSVAASICLYTTAMVQKSAE